MPRVENNTQLSYRTRTREACHYLPSISEAALALADLRDLHESRGAKIHSDDVLQSWLDHLDRFLAIYASGVGWVEAANYTAEIIGQGPSCSRWLRGWAKDFLHDRSALPYHRYANSGCDSLIDNSKFATELSAYITDAGPHVSAQDILDFTAKPGVAKHYHITKSISLDTACRWMSKLNFRWGKPPTGMYIDGHKCPDVVHYRQDVHLPTLAQCEQRM